MPVDIWFPLAIYFADLAESAGHNVRMKNWIQSSFGAAGPKRTSESSAWTGDIHRVDQLHHVPEFAWLSGEVGRHAYEYLNILGHDLSRIDVHIQRSWPVVSHPGQSVGRHAHHTADLSAVYYISVPPGNAGSTRFFNDSRQNELCGGLTTAMTSAYSTFNPLNYQSAAYAPLEGRLLLFPAKQTHDVLANESQGERISVSYDLILTSSPGSESDGYEFLMPPPSVWTRVPRPDTPQP